MSQHDEDVERYRKILEDWKPGPAKKPQPSVPLTPSESIANTQRVTAKPAPNQSEGLHSTGAILLLNERTLVVYQRPVPEKDYHLVFGLFPGGSVKTQGVALEGHHVEELGCLPPAWYEQLKSEMHWNRDLIVFHCYRYEDAMKIPGVSAGEPVHTNGNHHSAPVAKNGPAPAAAPAPAPEPAPQSPAAPEPTDMNGRLRRGQRLQIRFGNKMWDAVYWGKDEQGQVIAHKTYQNWSLMHLDLNRFKNDLIVDPEIDQILVNEIGESLMQSQSVR